MSPGTVQLTDFDRCWAEVDQFRATSEVDRNWPVIDQLRPGIDRVWLEFNQIRAAQAVTRPTFARDFDQVWPPISTHRLNSTNGGPTSAKMGPEPTTALAGIPLTLHRCRPTLPDIARHRPRSAKKRDVMARTRPRSAKPTSDVGHPGRRKDVARHGHMVGGPRACGASDERNVRICQPVLSSIVSVHFRRFKQVAKVPVADPSRPPEERLADRPTRPTDCPADRPTERPT